MSCSIDREEISAISERVPQNLLAQDEAFWARIASLYDCDESFVQLNYGYYHPSLRPVVETEVSCLRETARRGAHFKRFDSGPLLENARRELAELAGVDAEEILITRNASESLNIVIQGISLRPGDEVVCSDQDYVGMNQAWEQRQNFDGIVLCKVSVPLHPESDEQIVERFAAAISPRTRLLHVTHLIHLTGQILPVGKLCALGRQHGIPVVVDAAHSFAHVEFSIRELDCDYLGASLHKWLGAPLGTGMLFVRRDRIASLRPLYGDTHYPPENIRRLERFGNRPDSAQAGLREAIRWHHAISTRLKFARLSYLHESWTRPLRADSRYKVLTPRAPERHGAIGLLALSGVPAVRLCEYLLSKHGLLTAVHKLPLESGVRITPGLPTSLAHIYRLNDALRAAPGELS